MNRLPRMWFGLFLIALFWPLNWFLSGVRTAFLFFPLWLGYILIVDALVWRRKGSSLWSRSRKNFVLLFFLSTLVWWLFEAINWRTQNWEYLGREFFTQFEYNLLSTIAFSTVIPAVFETAELVRSFPFIERFASGKRVSTARRVSVLIFITGLAMLSLTLLWPKFFYPFVWSSLVLIFEPLNHWLGRPNLLQKLQYGDWRAVVSLSSGALICGFFWEMWNYYSFPKWIYHTPGAEFLRVFEMPLLGYLGYIPFALELYALKNFLWRNGQQVEV